MALSNAQVECQPLKYGGAKFIGTDARPEAFPSLCKDIHFDGLVPTDELAGQPVSIPIQDDDFLDTATFLSTKPMAPLEMGTQGDRPPIVPQSVSAAAINKNVFGAGYATQFRVDRPPQGIQILREKIDVPVDPMEVEHRSGVGFWGALNQGWDVEFNHDQINDPRYKPPTFPQPQGAFSQPAVATLPGGLGAFGQGPGNRY